MQNELPLIGLLKSPEPVSDDVLRTFGDSEEPATRFAVRWAWDNRRIKAMSQHTAAEHIGMPASHFSCVLNGQKYLPPHKINAFEWVVGNHAVSQTLARFAAIREAEQARQIGLLVAETLAKAA
jgi:hypothetical protein